MIPSAYPIPINQGLIILDWGIIGSVCVLAGNCYVWNQFSPTGKTVVFSVIHFQRYNYRGKRYDDGLVSSSV